MDKRQFGYKYLVENQDFQEMQTFAENAIRQVALDAQLEGILETITLPENQRELAIVPNDPVPDLTLDLNPGTGRDYFGRSTRVQSTTDLDISQDDSAVSTTVTTSGKEKWVTVFITYSTQSLDYEYDAQGTYYAKYVEDYFDIHILQSTEFDDTLSLDDKKLLRPVKPFSNPEWLYLGDVLKYYGMSQVVEADIYRDRKETMAGGNAAQVNYDNTGGYYDSGVSNVDEALEEIGARLETVEDFENDILDITRRNYSAGFGNISLYFDKTNNRLYSGGRDILDPSNAKLAIGSTSMAYAVQHAVSPDTNKIKVLPIKQSDYSQGAFLDLDDGYVYNPRIVSIGSDSYAVVYLRASSLGGSLQLRYRKITVDTGSAKPVATLDVSTDDIGDVGTYPVQTSLAKSGYDAFEEGYERSFDIAYDSVNLKTGVVWATGSAMAYQSVDSTGTTGTETPISPSIALNDAVKIVFNGSVFVVLGGFADGFFTYTVDNTHTIGTERQASSLYPVIGFTYCDNNTGSDYNLVTVFNHASTRIDVLAGLSDNSAAPTALGNFGTNVEGIVGCVWNDTIDSLAIFFKESASTFSYREISTGSVSGTDTVVSSSDNKVAVTNPVWISGASANYRMVGFNSTGTAPLMIKESKLFLITDQAGSITVNDLDQGDGGYIALSLKQNPRVGYKCSIADHDGGYITLNDEYCLYAEVNASDFSYGSAKVVEIDLTAETLATYTDTEEAAYNKPVVCYRYDAFLLDLIVVGLASKTVRKDTIWVEGTPEILPSSIKEWMLGDDSVTQSKIADNAVGTSELAALSVTDAKLGSNSVITSKINNLAVTGDKIANTTITGAKIASTTIDKTKLVGYGAAAGIAPLGTGAWLPEANALPKLKGLSARYIIADSATATGDNAYSGSKVFPSLKELLSHITYYTLDSGFADNYIGRVVVRAKADGSAWTWDGTAATGQTGKIIRHLGKAQGGGTDTITLDSDAMPVDDYYNYMWIRITAGTSAGEFQQITDYDGTSKVATVSGNWETQPDSTSYYEIGIDYSGLEIIFDKDATYHGSIVIDGGGNDIFDANFDTDSYTYTSGTRTLTRSSGTHTQPDLNVYPYVIIAHKVYKMSSTTTDTIVLDAETPYNGNPTVASGLIVGCCSGRFHNMVLDINMDNGSDSDMRGLMILNAEVELCGSVKRCAKTSGTASTAYRYMASNEGRDGAGVHLYYASIKGNMDVFNNYTDTGNGGGIFGLNCHFEFGDIFNNSATDQGGGICAKSSVVQLASSGRVRNVYNNSVTSVGFGGGIYVDYAYATVMGNIRNNSVGNGYGGGLCVGHGGVAVQGDLTYNHGGYGGGFAVMSGGAVYVNGEVRYNDGAQGGGFYINGYSIAHVGIITDNISTTGGGAFYLASSCVVLFAYVNNNSSSSGYDVDGSSGNSVLTGVVSATDTLNPAFSVNTNLLKLT